MAGKSFSISHPLRWSLALVFLLALTAWTVAVLNKTYDYDEIAHAHVIWQISQGAVPYYDFFECRPPFFWYAASPLAYIWPSPPDTMTFLRFVSMVGNLLVLGLILANCQLGKDRSILVWLLAVTGAVAAHPFVLIYLCEFRPDSWGYILLFAAIYYIRSRDEKTISAYTLYSFLCTWAVLFNPKFGVLTGLISAALLVTTYRDSKSFVPYIAGHFAGISSGLASGAATLWLVGIDPLLSYQMVIEYHLIFNRHSSFEAGLVNSLLRHKILLFTLVISVISWWGLVYRKKVDLTPYDTVIFAFLIFQAAFVSFPHKQYYVPWLLLGLTFVPYPFLWLREKISSKILNQMAIVAMAAASLLSIFIYSHQSGQLHCRYQQEAQKTILEHVPLGERITAQVTVHPITRKNSMYHWLDSFDPQGFNTEALMKKLPLPQVADKFRREHYVKELDQHPPAAIVFFHDMSRNNFCPTQRSVLFSYIDQHRSQYRVISHQHLLILVRKNLASQNP